MIFNFLNKKRLPKDIIKLGKILKVFLNKNICYYHTISDIYRPESNDINDIMSFRVVDDLSIIKIIGFYYNKDTKILSIVHINTIPNLEYIKTFLEHILIPITIDNKKHIRFKDTTFYISLDKINDVIGKLNDAEFELFNSTLKYNI
jgi:hypothetical protein